MCSKTFITSLIVLLLILIISNSSFSANSIRVMTYNIRLDTNSDNDDNWQYRKADMATYINSKDLDFLGIQEALFNQVDDLSRSLYPYQYIGVGRDDGKQAGEFMALFYNKKKWRIVEDHTFWLSATPDMVSQGWDGACHRVCTYGIFTNDHNDTIVVSNTHLDHKGIEARKNSVTLLKKHISDQKYPSILMGDFNFSPSDDLYLVMTNSLVDSRKVAKQIKEEHEGTFNGFKLSGPYENRIDFVYTDAKNWEVLQYESEMPLTKKGRQISDHFPVFATLKLNEKSDFEYASFNDNGHTLNYRILYPKNFDKSSKYPIILFLHGSGERGDDNEKQLIHGRNFFINNSEKFPAIVIVPQCSKEDYWSSVKRLETANGLSFEFLDTENPTLHLDLVMKLIEKYKTEAFVDLHKIYVGGLSMGGMGTWELLWRMPRTFAAAFPICGGGLPQKASLMKATPIWAFHGIKDDVVRPYHSTRMIEAVQKVGGKAKITLYPNANHNSWDSAFAEADFLPWLFSHSK